MVTLSRRVGVIQATHIVFQNSQVEVQTVVDNCLPFVNEFSVTQFVKVLFDVVDHLSLAIATGEFESLLHHVVAVTVLHQIKHFRVKANFFNKFGDYRFIAFLKTLFNNIARVLLHREFIKTANKFFDNRQTEFSGPILNNKIVIIICVFTSRATCKA